MNERWGYKVFRKFDDTFYHECHTRTNCMYTASHVTDRNAVKVYALAYWPTLLVSHSNVVQISSADELSKLIANRTALELNRCGIYVLMYSETDSHFTVLLGAFQAPCICLSTTVNNTVLYCWFSPDGHPTFLCSITRWRVVVWYMQHMIYWTSLILWTATSRTCTDMLVESHLHTVAVLSFLVV